MRKRLLAIFIGTIGVALTSVAAAGTAAAAPPIGGCPPGYTIEPVAFVVAGAGLAGPDPSMDPNGDGQTCLKLLHTGSGTRATWHDNDVPLSQ
jgi:hypothetical protein